MQALQGSADLLWKMWGHCRHWLESALLRAIGVEPPEQFECTQSLPLSSIEAALLAKPAQTTAVSV